MDKSAAANFIKEEAGKLGFSFCGISKAEFLEDEAPRLEEWLKRGYQGRMQYLENHFDKRLDPTLLVPGAKSVVSLLYNYYPKKDLATEREYKIAKYAYGEDYHFVVKDKLKDLMQIIQQRIGEVHGRAFVDSAPVHERAWAARGGLGWVGKNSLLLNRQLGSFFFLAELVIDLELAADGPIDDYCGTCTACMDACPTDAIPQPYVVDGSKCISYFTIELKEEIPEDVKGKFDNWIFGCDICQDVCPWNRFATPHNEPRLDPHPGLSSMTKADWEEITNDVFQKLFPHSAVKRAKLEGLRRNLAFVKENGRRLSYLHYYFAGDLPVGFKCQFLVIDEVHNGADETKAAGKQVEYSHADLAQQYSMHTRHHNETKQACDENELGIFATCTIHVGKLACFLIVEVIDKTLHVEHFFTL
ncbi:MAG: tRNA epoxyqueuosine(34) reductase QueG [Bacteroidia bacterium]|nr:tRNA epoxyqueuosine(34) reductase QueG [Bacteroidia bacterium]